MNLNVGTCKPFYYICHMPRKRNNKYNDAYQLYLDGLSLGQVAKLIGVTRQCVYKAFKNRNFILRSPNFQPHQYFDGHKFSLRNHGYYEKTTGKRELMHRYVWEKYNGLILENHDIHHKNHDRGDNRIENLEMICHREHAKKYSTGNKQYKKKE